MEDGKWKMENVERNEIPLCGRRWKTPQAGKEEDGRWKMVDGRWKMINDKLKIEYGILYPASGILYPVSGIIHIINFDSFLSALCPLYCYLFPVSRFADQ